MTSPWQYFSLKEAEGLEPWFVTRLDEARGIAGVPFKLTRKRDDSDIGVKDSEHKDGTAVDIACSDSRARFRIVMGLMKAGFTRIGIYNKHVHADMDVDDKKPDHVMWWGTSK